MSVESSVQPIWFIRVNNQGEFEVNREVFQVSYSNFRFYYNAAAICLWFPSEDSTGLARVSFLTKY
jgi:hypothetical protein